MRSAALSVLIVMIASLAAAQGPSAGEDVLSGRYVGRGYVYDEKGALAKTDMRMDIRAADGETIRVELAYFRDAVARFTGGRADGSFRIAIDEAVGGGDGTPAHARGQVVCYDGRRAAGSIDVFAGDAPDAPRLRRITFVVDKLVEKPAR